MQWIPSEQKQEPLTDWQKDWFSSLTLAMQAKRDERAEQLKREQLKREQLKREQLKREQLKREQRKRKWVEQLKREQLKREQRKRKWVGLSDEEKEKFVVDYYSSKWDRKTAVVLMNDYEAKLRELNT